MYEIAVSFSCLVPLCKCFMRMRMCVCAHECMCGRVNRGIKQFHKVVGSNILLKQKRKKIGKIKCFKCFMSQMIRLERCDVTTVTLMLNQT